VAKVNSDRLHTLILSMKASEKRYFKLQFKSDQHNSNPKFLQLFNQIEKQVVYDEELIIRTASYLTQGQLSNLKASLYAKVLSSLKNYNISSSPDMQTRELVDHAQLLFDRSLYRQCDDLLTKALGMSQKTDNLELQLMILKWKKNVISQTVGRGNVDRTNAIIDQVQTVNNRINNINTFTNLQLKLNTLYLKTGYVRNETDNKNISEIFYSNLPEIHESDLSLAEKSSLFSLYIDFYFFIQDFNSGYKFAKKWVKLFANNSLIYANLETYIKALNSLLIAQYRTNAQKEFTKSKRVLRALRSLPAIQINENISLKLFKYTYVHKFNGLFMIGDFSQGVALMEKIKPRIDEYIIRLDSHSRLIMYYKIACLYVGNSDYGEALAWLNKIINTEHSDLREDIHGFSRILSLICHYETGHGDILDYHVRSTYRFLLKRENLQRYHKYILNFLRHLDANTSDAAMIGEFEKLRTQLLPLETNPYEKRAFIYFDIISWLEGKIKRRPVQDVIREKATLLIERRNMV
jgi:hypothetical protein